MSLLILCCACGLLLADSWAYPCELQTKTHEFGNSKITVEIDGTGNTGFPPHAMSVFRDGAVVACIPNIAFEQVHASADQRYFVGLSNSGIPGTAFVVFDADGNLIREVKHPFMPKGIHTTMSVTVSRVWFDAKEPAVEFEVDPRGLRGCFGARQQRAAIRPAQAGPRVPAPGGGAVAAHYAALRAGGDRGDCRAARAPEFTLELRARRPPGAPRRSSTGSCRA